MRFEITNRILLWKCEACELYQHGHPAAQQAYANQYHSGYAKHRGKKIRTAMYRLNRVAKYLEGTKPRVLDIGCSVGCTVEAAKRRGWDAYGVDVSDDAVNYCRKRGLSCFHTNGLKLPFEDQSFDAVVSWHVIEHVADVHESIEEWRRVLKPNGVLVMETPDASSPKVRRLGASYTKFWAPEHTYTFTPDNLRRIVEPIGFQSLREPWTGSLLSMGPAWAPYLLGRHWYEVGHQVLGIHKAFQLFARRIERDSIETRQAA